MACDLSIADYQMAAKPDMFVKLEPLSTENYAVGFAKDGDAAMVDAVNKTLKEMYDDGTIAKHQVLRISLTFDHRLLDGAVAAKFEMTVRDLLEHPMDILL